MNPILSPYILSMIVAAMTCIFICLYVWPRRRTNSETIPLILLLLGITEWIAAALLGLVDQDLSHKMLWAKFEYIGVVSVPLAVLGYVLHHSGSKQQLTGKRLAWLGLIPLVTLVLAWTNGEHGLIWASYIPYHQNGLVLSEKTYGPGFWIYWAYSYGILLTATVITIRLMLASSKIFRWQSTLVVLGILAPWAGNLLYVLHIETLRNLDFTPIAFSLTGIMLTIGMFRWRLFDIKPIAHTAAIAGMADGLMILDNRGRIVEVNPAAQLILGLKAQEMVGKHMQQILANQLPLGERSYQMNGKTIEIKLANGRDYRDYELSDSPFYENQGSLGGSIIFLHDVTDRKRLEESLRETERKHAEAQLRQSENKYETLFQNMSVGVIYQSADGKVTDINPAAERILGLSLAQLYDLAAIHANLHTVHADGSDFPAEEHPSMVSLKTGKPLRDQMMGIYSSNEKEYLWISINTVPQFKPGEAEPYQVFVTFDDVTERERAEKALRESELRFRTFIEQAPIAISVSRNGIGEYANQKLAQIFGLQSVEESVGRPILEYFAPQNREDSQERARRRSLGLPVPPDFESIGVRPDGSQFPIYVAVASVPLRDGIANISFVTDITERRLAEQAVRASEERYRSLFEDSPISLWEEDFSAVKLQLDELRQQGVKDFETYLNNHPEVVAECIGKIKVVDVNKATLKLYRAESKADILDNFDKIIKTNTYLSIGDELVGIAQGKTAFEKETFDYNLTGEKIVIQLSWTATPGHEDSLSKVIVSKIDITERKHAEDVLARQAEELRQRNNELDRLYRATGSLLSSTPFDLQGLARTIVEVVLQEFGQANCSVFLIGKDSNLLDRLAVAGPYADQIRKTFLTVDGAGLVPQTIRSGQIINTPDVRAASKYVPAWEMARAELTIPLKIGDRVIGAIDVQSTEPDAFKPDDERLMSIFAERAASALERGRLNEELGRRIMQLTALHTVDMAISGSMDINLTLGILLDELTQQLGVHAADILLFNPLQQTFKCAAMLGFRSQGYLHTILRIGEEIALQVLQERQIVIIQNLDSYSLKLQRSEKFSAEDFVTYVGVPLIAKGQVKGVLEIFQRSPYDLGQEQRSFLELLAGAAAIAIDNILLFENLQSSNSELMMAYDETIEGWSRAMDLRDKETEGHTQRVTQITLRLASGMGFTTEELVHIHRGALLHDIGKMGIPDEILRKPEALTPEEWVIMRKHPQFAHDMLASIKYLRPALDIPYSHHEKWDGTGYPNGLKDEFIPLSARIFALADVWDALTSDRPYRKAWTADKTRLYIHEQAGKHFDPHLVEIFLKEVSTID